VVILKKPLGVFCVYHRYSFYNEYNIFHFWGKKLCNIIFNEIEIQRLEMNPHIKHVSDRSIAYHPDFKLAAVKENLTGKGPIQFFIVHGFDLSLIGKDKAKQCLNIRPLEKMVFIGNVEVLAVLEDRLLKLKRQKRGSNI
jgi:hypothetical protein